MKEWDIRRVYVGDRVVFGCEANALATRNLASRVRDVVHVEIDGRSADLHAARLHPATRGSGVSDVDTAATLEDTWWVIV